MGNKQFNTKKLGLHDTIYGIIIFVLSLLSLVVVMSGFAYNSFNRASELSTNEAIILAALSLIGIMFFLGMHLLHKGREVLGTILINISLPSYFLLVTLPNLFMPNRYSWQDS